MSEDGFHEIQLSGKQLVFLFMATTVVAVVIFLSGVMVGRGVRAEAASETETQVADMSPQPSISPVPGEATPTTPQPKIDTSTPPPQPVNDDLSYYNRLEKQGTPAESLKVPEAQAPAPAAAASKLARPAPPKPAAPAAPERTAAKVPPPPKVSPPAAASEVAPESSNQPGFAVQVAALGSRADAAALAKRLSGKGYDAYVVAPAAGGAAIYRVRVGRFQNRQEADLVARRLEKEEKFKPWIIR
ncbi:MAG: SPOR domain-containing protein [Acidobacteria bacterium]|nr:SPOR domain-containing protein [Acidobacteriota bacterium]